MKKAFTVRDSVPIERLGGYMARWAEKMPGWVTVDAIGKSGGYDILCARFTDPSVPEAEKEIALVTAQHSGMEISGMNTVLSVGNYLAEGGDRVREILRCQIVYLVPCPNCFSFAKQDPAWQFKNACGVDEYAGAFADDMTVDADVTPAAAALKGLIDALKPECIIDCHGIWYNEAIMAEFDGAMSFSNLNRTYDRGFIDAVEADAEAHGYAFVKEDALQTLFATDPICQLSQYRKRFRGGTARMLAGSYAYIQYHTFSFSMEVAWEESGMLRVLKALELGARPVAAIAGPGYPVRTMAAPVSINSILVGGDNAARRRESRVELWPQIHHVGKGLFYPESPYISGLFVTLNPKAARRILGEQQQFNYPMEQLLGGMEQEGYPMAAVRAALANHLDIHLQQMDHGDGTAAKLRHGITLRLGIPYGDATVRNVWLNGRALAEGEYRVLAHRNWRYVDITLPGSGVQPGGQSLPDVLLAVVQYDGTPRRRGIVEFPGGGDVGMDGTGGEGAE